MLSNARQAPQEGRPAHAGQNQGQALQGYQEGVAQHWQEVVEWSAAARQPGGGGAVGQQVPTKPASLTLRPSDVPQCH